MKGNDDAIRTASRGAGKTVSIHVGMTLRHTEKLLIEATVRSTDGNMKRAAAILGIDRSTLYKKMKLYGLVRWSRE